MKNLNRNCGRIATMCFMFSAMGLMVIFMGCAGTNDKESVDPVFRFMCTERAAGAGLGLRFQLGLDLDQISCFRGERESGTQEAKEYRKTVGHRWCSGWVYSDQCPDGGKCWVPYALANGYGIPDGRTQLELMEKYHINFSQQSLPDFLEDLKGMKPRENPLYWE